MERSYCGNNEILPEGYTRFGERYECLRKGVGIGKYVLNPINREYQRNIEITNIEKIITQNKLDETQENLFKNKIILFISIDILLFLLSFIVLSNVLNIVKPTFIMKDEKVDNWKLYIYSSLFALILPIIYTILGIIISYY